MAEGLAVGVAGIGVRVDVGRAVEVGDAVKVAVGSSGSGLGEAVSGMSASGRKVSKLTARQAKSVKNKARTPVNMRRMAQLYRLRTRFTFSCHLVVLDMLIPQLVGFSSISTNLVILYRSVAASAEQATPWPQDKRMKPVFEGAFPQNDEFRGGLWPYAPQTSPISHPSIGTKR